MLCMLFVSFLVSLPARLQPQDLFFMPGAITFWTYTWSTHEASTPRACSESRSYNSLVPWATTLWLVFEVRSYNSLNLHLFYPWGSNLEGSIFAYRLQPQDLFLLPGATTLWTQTCSNHWGSSPKGSFHYVWSVFMLYHIQLIINHDFHKSPLNMHHSYHFPIYMFSCILNNSCSFHHSILRMLRAQSTSCFFHILSITSWILYSLLCLTIISQTFLQHLSSSIKILRLHTTYIFIQKYHWLEV
jgi:hypothetical protein